MSIKEFFLTIYQNLFGKKKGKTQKQPEKDIKDVLQVKDADLYSQDATLDYFLSTWPGLSEKQKNDILASDKHMKDFSEDFKEKLRAINKRDVDKITEDERETIEAAYQAAVQKYNL